MTTTTLSAAQQQAATLAAQHAQDVQVCKDFASNGYFTPGALTAADINVGGALPLFAGKWTDFYIENLRNDAKISELGDQLGEGDANNQAAIDRDVAGLKSECLILGASI